MGLPSFPATSLLLVVASATATATVAAAAPPGADDGLAVVTIIARPADPLAVPGSSFVLTEADLKRIAHTDIHRMLQAVPGVYVKDEEGLGLFPNVGIRGASSARSAKITILEDGLPAAMAPYASPASYVFPTAARMSGIEVLKGPGTLRHGPFTVGGTINLISTPIPEQFGGRLDVETGSFGGRQLHATVGGSSGQWGALLEVYAKRSEGFARIDRSGRDTGHELFEQVGKIRWQGAADAAVEQSLELKLVNADESANQSYIGLTDVDFRREPNRRYGLTELDHIDRSRRGASLRHVLAFPAGWRLATSAYDFRSTRDFARLMLIAGQDITAFVGAANTSASRQAILDGADATDIRHQSNDRTFDARGLSTELDGVLRAGGVDHELVFGLRLHEDREDRLQPADIYDQSGGRLVLRQRVAATGANNRIGEARALSAWLVDQFAVGGLRFTATLRYEDIETREQQYLDVARTQRGTGVANALSNLSAGLGVTAPLTDRLSLLAGLHQGFAPPGSGATAGQSGEESLNSELGLRFRNGGSSIDVVGFVSDYRNALQNCTFANPCAGGVIDGTLRTGAARVHGVELAAATTLFEARGFRVPARLSWTWSEGEVTRDSDTRNVLKGDNLPYLPRHIGSALVGLERGRAALNLEASYVGAQCVDSLCRRSELDHTFRRSESYWLVDLAGTWQIGESAQVYARVENLLDTQRMVSRGAAGARTNMPRYAGIGVRLDF